MGRYAEVASRSLSTVYLGFLAIFHFAWYCLAGLIYIWSVFYALQTSYTATLLTAFLPPFAQIWWACRLGMDHPFAFLIGLFLLATVLLWAIRTLGRDLLHIPAE